MKYDFYENIGFEYVKSLMECSSPYGTMLVKRLSPLAGDTEREAEYENISRVIASESAAVISNISRLLMSVKDIRRSISSIGEGAMDEVSLFELKRYLLQLDLIAQEYKKLDFELTGVEIDPCGEALAVLCIDGSCNAGFYITDNYSDTLRQIRREKRDIEQKMRLSSGTELDSLKAVRLEIVERESAEETRIRREISDRLMPYRERIMASTYALGRVDFTTAKATLAKKLSAVRPETGSDTIKMCGMKNPYIEKSLRQRGRAFTPITIEAVHGTTVITGANMGGKSVALKTLALNCLCAMCGMYAFADSAHIPALTDIAMIAEDSEDTENGLSSFGGEIMRLRSVLRDTDKCVLLLFDELARGTNPQEGARIVRAMVRFLNGKNALSVFATHYDGVAPLAKKHYRIIGLRDFDFDALGHLGGTDIIAENMNYGLYEASPDEKCPREAIGICKLLLHGEPVLDEILSEE